jgi:hypothetical protein
MAGNQSLIKALLLIGVLAALVYFLSQKSTYTPVVTMQQAAPLLQQEQAMMAEPVVQQAAMAESQVQQGSAQMLGGVGSGLLPKEPMNQEDFGSFSAESILSGQNFLDPRAQIGYPETVGGTLRNANLQLRSEPVNPRDPVSIFNLSTIVPDTMRPAFEIGSV